MGRALIITVAGTSSRFRKSLGHDVLKAIYAEESSPSILDILLEYADGLFDHTVIVGGYQYAALQKHITEHHAERNIIMVNNEQYQRGSNLSLVVGIQALPPECDEVMFVEGDLVVDRHSFAQIAQMRADVISHITRPIEAKTAVAYYISEDDRVVYKYDTEHRLLRIDEPFKAIYNSGQIWKFLDVSTLKSIADAFTENDLDLTNLATVEAYFSGVSAIAHEQIDHWFNCNTVEDYHGAIDYITKEEQ